jgi:hypothetical protein
VAIEETSPRTDAAIEAFTIMSIALPPIRQPEIEYPETDGQPIAENTLQFQWIVTIKEGSEALFRDDSKVAKPSASARKPNANARKKRNNALKKNGDALKRNGDARIVWLKGCATWAPRSNNRRRRRSPEVEFTQPAGPPTITPGPA